LYTAFLLTAAMAMLDSLIYFVGRILKRNWLRPAVITGLVAGLLLTTFYYPVTWFYVLVSVIVGFCLAHYDLFLVRPQSMSRQLALTATLVFIFYFMQVALLNRAKGQIGLLGGGLFDFSEPLVTAAAALGTPALLYGVPLGWWLFPKRR